MPNDNIFDEVLGDVKTIMLEIRAGIRKQYKNVKPFGTEKVPPSKQLETYDQYLADPALRKQVRGSLGMDEAFSYEQDMEKLSRRENARINKEI